MVKRLLVPVGDDEASEHAMRAAIGLACQLGVGITGIVLTPMLPRLPAWPAPAGARTAASSSAGGVPMPPPLARFQELAWAAGVDFSAYHDPDPRPDQALIDAAEAQGCDLMVLVAEGRGAFGEFLFGAQDRAVLAGCALPLLVLR